MTNLSYHLLAGKCNLLFYFLSFSISLSLVCDSFLFLWLLFFALSFVLSLLILHGYSYFPIMFYKSFCECVCMRHRVFCIPSSYICFKWILPLRFEPYYLLFEKGINNFITILLSKCLCEFCIQIHISMSVL